MQYRPGFPQRLGSYEDALELEGRLFHCYNTAYYHTGIGMMTPASLQDGNAEEVPSALEQTLEQAWQKTLE